MYHIPGTDKDLFRVKLVKVHTASMPRALVEYSLVSIVDTFQCFRYISNKDSGSVETRQPLRIMRKTTGGPFRYFCFYDISSGAFIGCLPGFKPDLPVFIKFNADVIIA